MVGSCMGEISTGAQSVARTPMYALAGNCRFCPADPMKKAPTAVLNPLHHCWGPNWHKTTLKKDSMVPHVGTLAGDLSCPVQPPSLVEWPVGASPSDRHCFPQQGAVSVHETINPQAALSISIFIHQPVAAFRSKVLFLSAKQSIPKLRQAIFIHQPRTSPPVTAFRSKVLFLSAKQSIPKLRQAAKQLFPSTRHQPVAAFRLPHDRTPQQTNVLFLSAKQSTSAPSITAAPSRQVAIFILPKFPSVRGTPGYSCMYLKKDYSSSGTADTEDFWSIVILTNVYTTVCQYGTQYVCQYRYCNIKNVRTFLQYNREIGNVQGNNKIGKNPEKP